MPTDLRAALRAAADELADIAENERIATKQYRGGIADADACDAIGVDGESQCAVHCMISA